MKHYEYKYWYNSYPWDNPNSRNHERYQRAWNRRLHFAVHTLIMCLFAAVGCDVLAALLYPILWVGILLIAGVTWIACEVISQTCIWLKGY